MLLRGIVQSIPALFLNEMLTAEPVTAKCSPCLRHKEVQAFCNPKFHVCWAMNAAQLSTHGMFSLWGVTLLVNYILGLPIGKWRSKDFQTSHGYPCRDFCSIWMQIERHALRLYFCSHPSLPGINKFLFISVWVFEYLSEILLLVLWIQRV